MKTNSPFRGRLNVLLTIGMLSACAVDEEETEEDLDEVSEEIRLGALTAPTDLRAVVRTQVLDSGCSGTLISPNLVLTAGHCVCNKARTMCDESQGGAQVRFRDQNGSLMAPISGRAFKYPSYGPSYSKIHDVAVILIGSTAPVEPLQLMSDYLPNGHQAVIAGYGPTGADCELPNNGALFQGLWHVDSYEGAEYRMRSADIRHCKGDSGGPVLRNNGTLNPTQVYGVFSGWWEVLNGPKEIANSTATYYSWIMSKATYGLGHQLAPADYDNDGMTDIGAKFNNGEWKVDLAADGFGAWNWAFVGYGDHTSTPVPADYDGDGSTDLAIKNQLGEWSINYASNGLGGGFDLLRTGWGDSSSIPVPADYDGDRRVDLSVKRSDGAWVIDFASDGFNGWNVWTPNIFGGTSSIPVPGYYNNDLAADLSVKSSGGSWIIDYAVPGTSAGGFGTYGLVLSGYGPSSSVPVPGFYDADGVTDLSVKESGGRWYFDYFAASGFGSWNNWRDGYGSSSTGTQWGNPATRLKPTGSNPNGSIPGDYDGDQRTDLAIFVGGILYIDYSSSPGDGWNAIRQVDYQQGTVQL